MAGRVPFIPYVNHEANLAKLLNSEYGYVNKALGICSM